MPSTVSLRMPTVTAPPPMTPAPRAGNSTCGRPKVIATMSTTNDIRMVGAVRRNWIPCLSDFQPGLATPSARGIAG